MVDKAFPIIDTGVLKGGADISVNGDRIEGTTTPTPPELIVTIQVYLDDGVFFEYETKGVYSARWQVEDIAVHGYHHNDGGCDFEHYPPHRISKIKVKENKDATT
jgi:hypothetical protein